MSSTEHILQLDNVNAAYGDNLVLSNVNLEINKGEVLTIVGPSGGGKTTLLKCLNLLILPLQGTIRFKGNLVYKAEQTIGKTFVKRILVRFLGIESNGVRREINCEIHKYRQNFGMVFQEFNLWPNYTLGENIAAPLRWNNKIEEKDIKRKVLECSQIVQIDNILNKYPHEASGGQRQRAAIARALVFNPPILLLDEITSSLDPDLVFDILLLIEKLANLGITLVLVTHHMKFAERISNRITYINKGLVLQPLPVADFFNSRVEDIIEFLSHFREL